MAGFLDDEAASLESEVTEHIKTGGDPVEPKPRNDRAPRPDAEPDGDAVEPPAADAGERPRDPNGKFIPVGELQKERTRRQELERQLETMQAVDARIAALAARGAPPTAPAAPVEEAIPDIDEDPIGHFKAVVARQSRQIEDMAKFRQQQEEVGRNFQAQQEIQSWANQQLAAFVAETPDYLKAENHALTIRKAELAALGFDEAQAAQAIRQDLAQIVMAAKQRGVNPAKLIYDIAKARGYSATPPATSVPQNGVDTERLDTVARGQRLGASVDQAGGGSPPPAAKGSAQWIANASEEDFLAWASSKEGKRAMGR